MSGICRNAREITLEVAGLNADNYILLRHLTDRDVSLGTPGYFIVDDVWSTRAYITKCSMSTIYGSYRTLSITAVLLDGIWRQGHYQYFPVSRANGLGTLAVSDDLDYPYDMPYDLGEPAPADSISANEWCESACKLIIYGVVENPAITIGGNTYQVNVTVPAGSRLEIDGINKTVLLIDADGNATDEFANALRGSGRNGGSYIFQPLPAGTSAVTRDGSLVFAITWYEEESEPPWE